MSHLELNASGVDTHRPEEVGLKLAK